MPIDFETITTPSAHISGNGSYPVRRIFCVGRNYEAHAKEMNASIERDAAFYFTKSPFSLVQSDTVLDYPPGTSNYHYEMELVIIVGKNCFEVEEKDALDMIYGYAAGLDMTRRDLQLVAREKGRPWDTGKDIEQGAVMGPITPVSSGGHILNGRIHLAVNGETKQEADIADLIWSVPEIIVDLSKYYHLQVGDIIYTGTPAGVGPVVPGDSIVGEIEGLEPVRVTVAKTSHLRPR